MPIDLCSNGKWRIGTGPCQYKTKADAKKAYKAYLAQKHTTGTTKITGSAQEMAAGEIKKYIDPGKYQEIKQSDNQPRFEAFVIGQEGESKGNLIVEGKDMGSFVKVWTKSAIQKMSDKLRVGTKAFMHHMKDTNEHLGRVIVGEIVGKVVKIVKDKLSVIGIAYFKPEYRSQPLDVPSIETDLTIDKKSHEVLDLDDISGVAFGNSAIHKPGFSGATLQGTLQEMTEE